MKTYNGHRSWNAWNVSLWLSNDEYLTTTFKSLEKEVGHKQALNSMVVMLNGARTPDGAVYTPLAVKLALKDME